MASQVTAGDVQKALDELQTEIEDLKMAVDVLSRGNAASNSGFDARLRALEGKK